MDVDANTPQSVYQLREGIRPRREQRAADGRLVARQARQRARAEPRATTRRPTPNTARRSAARPTTRPTRSSQYYYSFARGFVLGFNLQGGYGKGLGGQPYPIFKNYYAGGIGSVRGYEPSSLGPRDAKTNDPIGGSRMAVGNIELTFPLPGTGYDRTLRVFTLPRRR